MDRVVVRLEEPREFFVYDPSMHDPLRPDELDRAGIELVLDRIEDSWWGRGSPEVLLLVPPAAWDPALTARMQAALDRWCARALQDERRERREAFRRHGLYVLIAVVAVTLAVLARPRLDDLAWAAAGTGFRDTIDDAVEILIWVALWTPFTAILVEWVPHLQRRRALAALAGVRLETRPDDGREPEGGAG